MLGAASVILDDHGRILFVKHGYGEFNWELPGGRGEAHESAEETARREAREEVGLELHIDCLTGDPSDLPRPLSDFTERRIADALSGAMAGLHTIGPRVWRR